MTIPDELVEIGAIAVEKEIRAYALDTDEFASAHAEIFVKDVLSAVLPELARMMLDEQWVIAKAKHLAERYPGPEAAEANARFNQHIWMMQRFFEEKFGLEVKP